MKEILSHGLPNVIGSIAKDANPVANVPPGALEIVNRGRQNAIGLIALDVLNALHRFLKSLVPASSSMKSLTSCCLLHII